MLGFLWDPCSVGGWGGLQNVANTLNRDCDIHLGQCPTSMTIMIDCLYTRSKMLLIIDAFSLNRPSRPIQSISRDGRKSVCVFATCPPLVAAEWRGMEISSLRYSSLSSQTKFQNVFGSFVFFCKKSVFSP